ncbi:MAG: protein kinase, partial [Phycisphaeraceae bacterium]|nr:protein kinase [Phycisphaeraceae bacterium]
MAEHDPASIQALTPGQKIGKFEVVEQIGTGGMSIVWKAYDKLLDRHVAIKQMLIEGDGGSQEATAARQQFVAEAAVHKRISSGHDHLLQIIEVIDDENGLFIVTEYVEGQSLEQRLAANGDPIPSR